MSSQEWIGTISEGNSSSEDSEQNISIQKYSVNVQDVDEGKEENKNIKSSLNSSNRSRSLVRVSTDKYNESDMNESTLEKGYNIAEDLHFKKQVTEMLRMKYKVGFMKAISSVLYTIIILLLLLCIIYNCNVLSVILFISVAFT